MKNITTIILSLVLAAAIITGLIIYGKYADTKDALILSEKKLADFDEKINQLNQETNVLNDQIEKYVERFRELETVKSRAVELENAITVKDQGLSVFEEKLNHLQNQFEKEKTTNEALRDELSSKDTMVIGLQKDLEVSRSRGLSLEDKIAKATNKIEGLQRQISDLEGEKAIAETKMGQLKTSFDANTMELKNASERISQLENTISAKDQDLSAFEEKLHDMGKQLEQEKTTKAALENELSYRDAATAGLREKLKHSHSRVLILEDKIAKATDTIEKLERQISTLKGEKTSTVARLGQLKSTYEALVSDLKNQIENQEVAIKTFKEEISVTFVDRILFEFGRAKITPGGRKILGKIGDTLKNVKGKQIRVVGHTDNVPISPGYHYKFPSNWELSAARAASVVNYLQNDLSLDPTNLEAVGRSFYEPIASNETSKGRAQNRRVNIIIAPKVD